MIWGHKELEYVVSRMFDAKRMRQWPGIELVRDDGYYTRRSSDPDGFYVVALHRESLAREPSNSLPYRGGPPYRDHQWPLREPARRLFLKIDLRLSDGDLVHAIDVDLCAQLDKFWQDKNPDWPGLGPAGRQR